MYISDDTLEIVSADGDEWSWNMTNVTISRSSVDRFHLSLDGEDLYFLPVDTRRFLTTVVQKNGDSAMEPHKGWLRRRIEAAQAQGGDVAGYELEIEEVVEPQSKRRGHAHEWSEACAVGVVTRRCVGCGHVSIDATGVTSTLESASLAG